MQDCMRIGRNNINCSQYTELTCKGEESMQNKTKDNNYSSWELHYFDASMISVFLLLNRSCS